MCGNIIGIETDIVCIVVSLLILFTLQMSYQLKIQTRMFRSLLIWFSIFCFTGVLTHILPAGVVVFDRLTVCLKTITCSFIGYYWFTYTYYATGRNSYKLKKWAPIAIAPAIIVVIYGLVDFFTHISDETLYLSPFLWIIITITGSIYFLLAFFIAFKRNSQTTNPFHKCEYRYLSIIALIPLTAMFVQYDILNLNISEPIVILTILHLYIKTLRQQISIDPATGLNNKHKLASYLSQVTQNLEPNKRLFFVQIGIDYYDKIQKKFGLEKTKILMEKIAQFLKKQSLYQGAFLARYDTDKFAIVCEKDSIADLELLCNEIIRNCDNSELQGVLPWKISLNMFWAEYGTEKCQNIGTWLKHVEDNCIKPATSSPISISAIEN